MITIENRLAYYEALDQWMTYYKVEFFVDAVFE